MKASASIDFTIIVPKFVYLQVGTGTNLSDNTTVDNLVFSVPADHIGDGTPVSGVGTQVRARVLGNNDTITLSSTTLGPMKNSAGDTISYSDMNVTVAADTSATVLAHPALVDGSTTSINLPTTGGKITDLDAKWTFTYRNNKVVPAGTYGGVNMQNGRVTYTVSMP